MNEDVMNVKIDDQVSGRCPSCRCPELYLDYSSGIARGERFYLHRYTLRCRHQSMCKWREEFGKGDE